MTNWFCHDRVKKMGKIRNILYLAKVTGVKGALRLALPRKILISHPSCEHARGDPGLEFFIISEAYLTTLIINMIWFDEVLCWGDMNLMTSAQGQTDVKFEILI